MSCKKLQQIFCGLAGISPKVMACSVTVLLFCLTVSACTTGSGQPSKVMSPEAQKRLKIEQEAKNKQERNNQIRAANYQIQEQNRMELREQEKLLAERAAQRNYERAARQAEAEKNQNQ